MTQQDKILSLLRSEDRWFYSWEFVKVDTPKGWLGTSGERACRRMSEIGIIKNRYVKKNNKRYVQFRTLKPKLIKIEKPKQDVLLTYNRR